MCFLELIVVVLLIFVVFVGVDQRSELSGASVFSCGSLSTRIVLFFFRVGLPLLCICPVSSEVQSGFFVLGLSVCRVLWMVTYIVVWLLLIVGELWTGSLVIFIFYRSVVVLGSSVSGLWLIRCVFFFVVAQLFFIRLYILLIELLQLLFILL